MFFGYENLILQAARPYEKLSYSNAYPKIVV